MIEYGLLAKLFGRVEGTSKRLEIQEMLKNYFRMVMERNGEDVLASVYLCLCTQLKPAFEGVQIGIGDALLIKAIGEATGSKSSNVKKIYEKVGDLGIVAMNARSTQKTLGFVKPTALTVKKVYGLFCKIANMKGNKSQDKKVSVIKSLLVNSQLEEAKYLIRGLQGKLRIGLAEKTILIALAHAMGELEDVEKEIGVDIVKRCYGECPNYDIMIPALMEHGLLELHKYCHLKPGTPVSPMLARPTKCYAVVFDRFANRPFTVEYKYDGERAQIHCNENGEMNIFSRNFENSTERFPDVVEYVQLANNTKNTSFILDAEVVAFDIEKNIRLPFQVLSTRARKV